MLRKDFSCNVQSWQDRPVRTTSFDSVAALGANDVTIKAFSHTAPTPSVNFVVHLGELMCGATIAVWLDQLHGNAILIGNLKMRSAVVVN